MARDSQPTSFDVVLKVAERCNLACNYCYYYFQEYDGNKNTAFMQPNVVDEVPRFLGRSIDALKLDRLNVVLHGGEPLLMKKAQFDDLCTKVRSAVANRVALTLSTQTNGVLIDDEWIAIFEKHRIHVGVSLDGPKEIHDARRKDHAGRGSYDGTVRGLKRLQVAADQGRIESAGAICVMHGGCDGAVALDHLIQLGVRSPDLNFPRGGWDSPEVLDWDQKVEAHRNVARYTLKNLVHPKFRTIRGVSEVLLTLVSDPGARINDRRASSRINVATISSDGLLLPDDNLLGVDKSFSETGLTIFGSSLRDLLTSPQWLAMVAALDTAPAECSSCEWYRSCRGGELYNRFSREAGFARHSAICNTIKMVHEECARFLLANDLITLEELAARMSERPTATGRDIHDDLLGDRTRGPETENLRRATAEG